MFSRPRILKNGGGLDEEMRLVLANGRIDKVNSIYEKTTRENYLQMDTELRLKKSVGFLNNDIRVWNSKINGSMSKKIEAFEMNEYHRKKFENSNSSNKWIKTKKKKQL